MLTPHDLAEGTGTGYAVGAVDKAANNSGKLRYQLQKVKGPKVDSMTTIKDFEKYASELDKQDNEASGEKDGASLVETISEKYRRLGRPYLRSAGTQDGIQYILVMSPLMARILSNAPFIQADITYDENKEYRYLFNVTAFDDVTMKWIIVCRIRITKQNYEAYSMCFKMMFERCKKECLNFEVGRTLVGIIVDWSDAQAKGLRDAVGKDMADSLLKGCQVHWIRSYQRIAEKVAKSSRSSPEKRQIEIEAFKLIAAAILKVKSKEAVMKLFQCLCGKRKVSEIHHFVPGIECHHITTVDNMSDWSKAQHWVNWWTQPSHLRMLSINFSNMDKITWMESPTTTNAVERKNSDSKVSNPLDLKTALLRTYQMDKAVCLQYIAASEQVRISYRVESRQKQAADKRRQRASKQYAADKNAVHGPPDKTGNFNAVSKPKKRHIKQSSEEDFQPRKKKVAAAKPASQPDLSVLLKACKVLYDDGNWYKGQVTGFEMDEKTKKWMYKIQFDDGETTLAAMDDPEVTFTG